MEDSSQDLLEIALLSLKVSGLATLIAAAIGIPLGALLGFRDFIGKRLLIGITNGLMGIPPVVAGLAVYMLFSNAGAFGVFQLLYTPTAMIIAQAVIITPIVASLTRQAVVVLWRQYRDELTSFKVPNLMVLQMLITECRDAITTSVLAGFGRGIAEVGAVMIVGGNIDHFTRTMTTAIAMETRKGNLETALMLGGILLAISIAINTLVAYLSERANA